MSPLQWLISQRVEASLPLLEGRTLSVDQVATAVGFGSTVTYRQHFSRIMRTTPTGWRKHCLRGRDRVG